MSQAWAERAARGLDLALHRLELVRLAADERHRAPSAASSCAVQRPMPEPPPVTTTTWPANRPGGRRSGTVTGSSSRRWNEERHRGVGHVVEAWRACCGSNHCTDQLSAPKISSRASSRSARSRPLARQRFQHRHPGALRTRACSCGERRALARGERARLVEHHRDEVAPRAEQGVEVVRGPACAAASAAGRARLPPSAGARAGARGRRACLRPSPRYSSASCS